MGLNKGNEAHKLKAYDTEMIDFVTELHGQGWVLIPENSQKKHPSYVYSHLMRQHSKLELSKVLGLFKSYGRTDRGLRLAGLKYEGAKNTKPVQQIVCLDIENDSTITTGQDILSAILTAVPEISDMTYIEKTPSGGFHIFFLIDYDEENLVETKALAYDGNDKKEAHLLAEILGFNRNGFTVGFGQNDKYAPLYADTSINDLDSVLPSDLIDKVLEVIGEFNQYDFAHDISQIDENLLTEDQKSKISKVYNSNPLFEFNEHPDAYKEVVECLTSEGYIHITDREDGEDVISLFKHANSSHDHTLSVHKGHKTVWSYSTSDPIFQVSTSYRFSDVIGMIKFERDFVLCASYLNKTYGVGRLSGIPTEFRFFTVYKEEIKGRLITKVDLNSSVYASFLEHLGYRSFLRGSVTEVSRIHDNIITREVSVEDIKKVILNIIDNEFPNPSQREHRDHIKHALHTNKGFFSIKTFYQSLRNIEYAPNATSVIRGQNSVVQTLKSDSLSSYHFFKDCIIEIRISNPSKMIVHEYKFVEKFIMAGDIIDFNLFKDTTEIFEGKEITITPSDFRGFKFFNFMFDTVDNKYDRWKQLACSLGYMLTTYKNPREARAVVLMDAQTEKDNAVVGRKAGRTGKSLMVDFLKAVTNPGSGYIIPVDGVSLKDHNEFSFGNIKPQTKIVAIDDLNSSYAMANLYTAITGEMKVNAKFVQHRDISFADSPKLIVTSNYMIIDDSPSTKKRTFPNYLHPTFSETFTPFDRYGEMFFANGDPTWDEDKQRQLQKLALMFVSMYLKFGVIRADEDIERQRRSQSFAYIQMSEFLAKEIQREFVGSFDPLGDNQTKMNKIKLVDNVLYFPNSGHSQLKLDKVETQTKYRLNCPDEAREFKRVAYVMARFVDFFASKGIEYSEIKQSSMKYRIDSIDLNLFDIGFNLSMDDGKVIATPKNYE